MAPTFPFTVPAANRFPGEFPFFPDINNAYNAIAAIAGTNVCDSQWGGGADPSGVLDSTTAFQNAVTALLTTGGVLYVPPGTYKITSTVTGNMTKPVSVIGAGWGVSNINFTGSGDCFRLYCQTLFTGGNLLDPTCTGGRFTGLTINGASHSGTGASALHIGDLHGWTIDVQVQNFTAANDIGVHMDNQWFWTEKAVIRVHANECRTPLVFDQSPAGGSVDCSNSFDGDVVDVTFYMSAANAGFNGVVFQNGAAMVTGKLAIGGNMQGSASSLGNTAALTITGISPSGTLNPGSYSYVQAVQLDMAIECDGSGANTPHTIFLGTPTSTGNQLNGNFINNSYGSMFYGGLAFQNCNSTSAVTFWGPVVNDAVNSNVNTFANFLGGAYNKGTFSADNLTTFGSLDASTAGGGLKVAEGTNAKQGTAVLVAGSKVVSDTAVTASSRIFLTSNADGGTPGWLRVSARTAGTSFTITSSSGTDTSTVAYEIFEPG